MRHVATGLLAASLTLSACSTMTPSGPVLGTADMRLASGQSVGTATLSEVSGAPVLDVAVTGLPPGTKGIHFHTSGVCTPPDFQSAGGHLNPTDRAHGLQSPQGAHVGDLPNLQVEPDGTARARIDLRGGKGELLRYLFDADGTSVMIHAQADDNLTDPSGNSGARIACGVLRRAS